MTIWYDRGSETIYEILQKKRTPVKSSAVNEELFSAMFLDYLFILFMIMDLEA